MVERTTPKEPIELAWDEYVASMEGRLYGQTDAFKFAWMAAKRTWVGLTDEEIYALESVTDTLEFPQTVRAIEAKIKEKNNA
jgi:hypothetical protein